MRRYVLGCTQVEQAESSALTFEQVTLTWQDVSYSVPVGKGEQRQLLDSISGMAAPGRLVALMGSSGAGKTTLLDVLAGRKNVGTVSGTISLNGQRMEHEHKRLLGYVEQFDSHIPLQTVREALQFSANLRLPASTPADRKRKAVDETLELLSLTKIADVMVGDSKSGGISPGQRKVLSIGVELIANPPILFLDEPTTGLDSRSALQAMQAIRAVASANHTVVCTIHQPSAELFYMFNDLVLLKSGGRLVYAGPIGFRGSEMVSYFQALPGVLPHPPRLNPASWALQLLVDGARLDGARASAESISAARRDTNVSFLAQDAEAIDFAASFAAAPARESMSKAITETPKEPLMPPGDQAGRWVQTANVLRRHALAQVRDIPYNGLRALMFPLLGLLFGLSFLDLEADSVSGLLVLTGSLVTCVSFSFVVYVQSTAPWMMEVRNVFYRESYASMYGALSFTLAQVLVDVPFVAVFQLCILAPFYFLAGLEADVGIFFHSYLIFFFAGLAGSYMGQFFVAFLPNDQVVSNNKR